MSEVDISILENDKTHRSYLSIGSVATFVNNINHMFKLLGGSIDNYQIYYRGHSNINFKEIPSIYRSDARGKLWVDREDCLCDEIMRECPHDFDGHNSAFEKLVKMQHYELPTRLLDITENPLVALYFACLPNDDSKDDGEILVYFIPKEQILNHTDSIGEALSCISFLPQKTLSKTKINLVIQNMQNHTSHLLNGIKRGDLDKVVCVRARKSNPRIIRQQGAFFLFGCKNSVKQKISDLPYKSFKMEVMNSKKKLILNELERYGISEKTLFPEIDKVAHHLRTH